MASDVAAPAGEPPGQPLGRAPCPACGQVNRAEARFCRACGQRLPEEAQTAPSAAEPPAEPVAEPLPDSSPEFINAPLDLSLPAQVRRSWGGAVWAAIGVGAIAAVFVAALVLQQTGWLDKLFGPRPPATSAARTAPKGPPPTGVPIDTMVAWDPGKGDPKSYLIDGFTLTVSSRPQAGGAIPLLHIVAPDGRAADVLGDASPLGAAASFGVGHIDPAIPGDQVVFATNTGGAHCCDHVRVLELDVSGWTGLDLGQFQGATLGVFPKDVDGDGVLDFVMADDRFAYAFTDFAASYEPPRIFNVVGGVASDVSTQPRYAKLYRRDMKTAQAACLKHGNGGCAAFVADASRLGLHDWAWRIMLASYDPNTGWTWPVHCAVAATPCPAGQAQSFTAMAPALAAFLQQAGYAAASQPEASDSAAPSFDCTGADTAVLDLICNTPALSQADHDMSAAYADALSRSPDADALREEQRVWFTQRDATAADVAALSQIYAERIQELETQGPK